MSLLIVYAKREPTTDPVVRKYGDGRKQDTVFYHDAECTKVFARKPWYQSGHPRRNSKEVMLNCYRWQLQWVH